MVCLVAIATACTRSVSSETTKEVAVEDVAGEIDESQEIDEKGTGFSFFAKSAVNEGSYVSDASGNEEDFGMLVPIPDRKYLFYAKGTGIVYIVQTASAYHRGYGYMAPFYSKNGNLYRYEDGFFKEVQ